MPYIPHTPEELHEMLSVVGVRSLDELFSDIPSSMRPQSFDLPKGQSEAAVCGHFEELAAKNCPGHVSFLGAGFYNHDIPKAVDALSGRSEFYTAYTPYQAECSQGTLQAIFEFQTAVSRLMEMDCGNASVYDGGTAIFEAAMMAVRSTRRRVLVVDEAVNPIWRSMLEAYVSSLDLEIRIVPQQNGCSDMDALMAAADATCAAVIVQNPNFFGAVADYTALFAKARSNKAFGVISVYPVMQSVLKTPGEMGADVAVAEGQSLGMNLSFGGPYLGLMACRKEHIRRAKATSNICSNQALCAMRSLIHMSLLGPQGLTRVAENNMALARYAVERLIGLKGVKLLNSAPYGSEVALRLPMPAAEVVKAMTPKGVVPGYPLGHHYPGMENVLLLSCTEANNRTQIDKLAEIMGGLL